MTNGGFETGSFSNWTQFDNTGFSDVRTSALDPFFPSPEGIYHARFGPVNSTGGIFQNFATTAGQIYRVSYTLAVGGTSNTSFLAQVGNSAALTTLESLTNPAVFGYTARTFTFTATTAISQIRFTMQNNPNWWRLDNVIIRNTVPELNPSHGSLPLLFVFFSLLLIRERRLCSRYTGTSPRM